MSTQDSKASPKSLWTALGALAFRRRGRTQLWFFLLLVAGLGVLPLTVRFDSDPFSILPQEMESVRLLRAYASGASQERLLTFALVREPGQTVDDADVASLEDSLRKRHWVLRTFGAAPSQTAAQLAYARELLPGLLLAGGGQRFDDALAALEPDRFGKRLDRLVRSLESGVPGAEAELFADPLGVLRPTFAELERSLGGSGPGAARPLGSADGSLRILLVETSASAASTAAAEELMREVNAFMEEFRRELPEGTRLRVTGRAAYVSQVGRALFADIRDTFIGATVLVLLCSWVAFRTARTLASVAVLLVCGCVVSLALGGALLGPINLVTAGFCALLVGMGVDFALLLTDRYRRGLSSGLPPQQAAAVALGESAPGVLCAAATTSLAFLALVAARSGALTQVGVLVAIGLTLTAALMVGFLFPLCGKHAGAASRGRVDRGWDALALGLQRRRVPTLGVGAFLLLLPAGLALVTGRTPVVESNLRSLEPDSLEAGATLAIIQERTRPAAEPLMVALRENDPAFARNKWSEAHAQWPDAKLATPELLVFDPAASWLAHRSLKSIDWKQRLRQLRAAWEGRGLAPHEFEPVEDIVGRLAALASGPPPRAWEDCLPKESGWWFLIQRFLPGDPALSFGFVTPGKTGAGTTSTQTHANPGFGITGMGVMQADLQAWTRNRVPLLLAVLGGVVLATLAFFYRRPVLVALHAAAMTLALAATVGLLALTGTPLNIVTAMGLPIVLGVGVDYGIQFLVTHARGGEPAALVRPVVLSAATTAAGFASLCAADNPALRGLGIVGATGIACCLAATLLIIVPALKRRPA